MAILTNIIKETRLSELKTGEEGVIVKVLGHGAFRKRITEMGFVKGKKVKVIKNAKGVKCNVRCDALLIDRDSRSDTYPTMQVDEDEVQLGHEASVSKVGEEQLFYLMSRGLTEVEATSLIVNGFIEPFTATA